MAKCELELGNSCVGYRGDRAGYTVHAGRWSENGTPTRDCVVICQRRSRGPLGKTTIFKMAIEAEAVETITEALTHWLETYAHLQGEELLSKWNSELE